MKSINKYKIYEGRLKSYRLGIYVLRLSIFNKIRWYINNKYYCENIK